MKVKQFQNKIMKILAENMSNITAFKKAAPKTMREDCNKYKIIPMTMTFHLKFPSKLENCTTQTTIAQKT